jgi:hypothetical protein
MMVLPMNCLEFRRIVGAEPHSAAPEVAEHAAQCEACARYQQQMQQMDQLIHRALAIDVAAPGVAAAASGGVDASPQATTGDPAIDRPSRVVSLQAAPKAHETVQPLRRKRANFQWSLAASLLLAIAAGVFWVGYPRETLAEEVVAHALGEPESLQRTAAAVTDRELSDVLAQAHVRLKPGMGRVSYATVCPFRGHHVPHFVVQTAAGPVTVLLLRDEKPVSKPRDFVEGKFQGVIVPAPQGVLAVLGQNTPLDAVAAEVLAAVEYQDAG